MRAETKVLETRDEMRDPWNGECPATDPRGPGGSLRISLEETTEGGTIRNVVPLSFCCYFYSLSVE
jgi:hypothetical protein